MRFASNQQLIGSASLYVLPGTLSYADVGPSNTP
jgi:hypothetical protein